MLRMQCCTCSLAKLLFEQFEAISLLMQHSLLILASTFNVPIPASDEET